MSFRWFITNPFFKQDLFHIFGMLKFFHGSSRIDLYLDSRLGINLVLEFRRFIVVICFRIVSFLLKFLR